MSDATNTSTRYPSGSKENPMKRKIVKAAEYEEIYDFINRQKTLAIDCEMDLLKQFPQFEKNTLKSILEMVFINRVRSHFWRYEAKSHFYLKLYEERCVNSARMDPTILLGIAREAEIGPVMMCRSILKIKYNITDKVQLTQLINSPHLIEDPQLSANVAQCVCSDSQYGPLINLRRRVLGEEYEFKLKQMATEAGMHYYDENDLRRLGYDKTPDIKMLLPFLYNGEVINWIESKAIFGHIKTHKVYIQQQLNSYCNRFGSGIVIYWFGYHEDTATLPDNSIGIIVLDDFPAKDNIQLFDLTDACKSYDSVTTVNQEMKKEEESGDRT